MNAGKFLEFNGEAIHIASLDAKSYVAVKSICDALGLDFNYQLKKLKRDSIFLPVLSIHSTPVDVFHLGNFLMLPELYAYGWLFSIKLSNKVLQQLRWQLYRVLFNHLHGSYETSEMNDESMSNTAEKKLAFNTDAAFIAFMKDIRQNLLEVGLPWNGYNDCCKKNTAHTYEIGQFIFDRRKLFTQFVHVHPELTQKDGFGVRQFNKWLISYSAWQLNIPSPKVWKASSEQWIQFTLDPTKKL